MGDDAVSSESFLLLDSTLESAVFLLECAAEYDEAYPEKLAASVFDDEVLSIDVSSSSSSSTSSSFTLDAINFSMVPHIAGDQQEMFCRFSTYSHVIVVFFW